MADIADEQIDDAQCAALVDALEPRPVCWKGMWICHKSGEGGIGIGKTPAEAHEDYSRAKGGALKKMAGYAKDRAIMAAVLEAHGDCPHSTGTSNWAHWVGSRVADALEKSHG